ncbi:MAG: PH domain-containing protein, partial [Candidatus Micrarchaeota archaeon]
AFELRGDCFFSRKGVFKASYTMIRYERVQDIHVNQSFFEMLFGLWNVSIFTATATDRGSENIPGLSKENAESLKTALFAKIKKVKKVVD